MATSFTNGLSYEVKHDPKIFAEVLAKSYTLDNENISIIPNVKATSVKINKFGATKSGLVQTDGRDCAWTPNGAVTLGEKTINLAELKVQVEICKEDLDELLSQEQYKSIKRGEVPPEFEDILVSTLQNAIGQDNERFIWTATTTGSADPVNGLVAQLTADSDVIDYAMTAPSVSSIAANVAGAINSLPIPVLDANDTASSKEERVFAYISPANWRLLLMAFSNASIAPTNTNVQMPNWTKQGEGDSLRIFYLGVEVVKAGIDNNHIVVGQKGNLIVATDLMEDATLTAESGKEPTTKNKLFIEAKYKFGVGYAYGSEIVLATYTAEG